MSVWWVKNNEYCFLIDGVMGRQGGKGARPWLIEIKHREREKERVCDRQIEKGNDCKVYKEQDKNTKGLRHEMNI